MRSGQDKHLGLYRKFEVTRHDPEGKHKNCFYYVLDCDHDEFAIPALESYIAACEEKFPKLASDLRGVVAVAKIKQRVSPDPRPADGDSILGGRK